ncbi:MAG: hypothetical protein ACJAVV_001192 [Alphaproteobacteria bacterium]|jgi:hypothetical protein
MKSAMANSPLSGVASRRNERTSFNASAESNTTNNAKAATSTVGMTIGGMAILFALISYITNMQISAIIAWMDKYFGITFTVLFASLLIVSVYAILKVNQRHAISFWAQVGAQAANGISTLALTFTLLGISLGIGALADQSLTPDNVNTIISVLTTQFSMAFMTTVVGLPASTAVRAWLSILLAKQAEDIVNEAKAPHNINKTELDSNTL